MRDNIPHMSFGSTQLAPLTKDQLEKVYQKRPEMKLVVPRRTQAIVKKTQAEFVEEHFHTDIGEKFVFGEGRKYFLPLYNINWPFIVILASRQAEKSTYEKNLILSTLFLNDNDSAMYATATGQNVKDFSRRKIGKQFSNNQKLKEEFLGRGSINNVYDKYFVNGSSLHFRSIGLSVESARGLPVRQVYFDESQSIPKDHISVVMEITQSFDNPKYAFTGTPLTKSNNLTKLFRRSKQYEWLITCEHCSRRNQPLGMNHVDTGRPYLFCQYCGKPMSALNGRWVAMNPSAKYPGFRICRLMTPTAKWRTEALDGILDKYDGPNAYPLYRFKNEVLGLEEDVGAKPISEDALYKMAMPNVSMVNINDAPKEWIIKSKPVGTVDWAWSTKNGSASYTIFALWAFVNDKITLLYAMRFIGPQWVDPENVLNHIAEVCMRFNVQAIATDYGVGHKENIRLRPKIPNIIVVEIMYAGSYNKLFYNQAEDRYHLGRTESLDRLFSGFSREKFLFSSLEESKSFLEDIMNVFTEYNPSTKKTQYDHEGPDDFCHLCNYAKATFEKILSIDI